MSKKKDDLTALSFEQALERLESLADEVESGDTNIEQALARCQEGRALLQHCEAILTRSEQQFKELRLDDNGQMTMVDDEGQA